MKTSRVFVEKGQEFQLESKDMLEEVQNYLKVEKAKNIRIIDVYDFYNVDNKEKDLIVKKVLEDDVINKASSKIKFDKDEMFFRVKFLDSQYNQKEDIVNEIASKFILSNADIIIKHSQIISVKGVNKKELDKIKGYFINDLEKIEISTNDYFYKKAEVKSKDLVVIDGFTTSNQFKLNKIKDEYEIGLDIEDLEMCRDYFKGEKREPNLLELKLIDTYWSDHCRHTTFMTEIKEIVIEEGKYKKIFEKIIDNYIKSRELVYENKTRAVTLMDLATINMKEQVKLGVLDNKEETDEVNACSIEIDVDVNGIDEKWLLMFKNETHNHPTEMEPFGGAATCLGGAIRDPLSGRSYIYQAMRISGSKDPREDYDKTIDAKLSQRFITQNAMKGYSSYGNQIGSATGYVKEYYDDGFVAKRLECGALVAAAPKENVYRGQAEAGDIIILVGGKTGRDGLGGAVGSSKKHTEDSLESSGAEVQKGNPLIERKILRLFRKKEVSEMIKVCNDFGAGGVSVAIGELADGLEIYLDRVPLKYEGLDPMEIALSESQERMAVLIAKEDEDKFLEEVKKENLEGTVVAVVTDDNTLRMKYNDKEVTNLKRSFLDTNGSKKSIKIKVNQPRKEISNKYNPEITDMKMKIDDLMENINMASQKSLVENFDNTVGANAVIMPYGGKYRLTPSEGMVGRIPVLNARTNTCSIMTNGYNPEISKTSPLHGGYYAVIESVAKVVALGGDYKDIRLTFQEYFERLGNSPEKWGKPFAALLGAYEVQRNFNIAAIGGKDSMSGTFEDIDVPPTLISFAVAPAKINKIITNEIKSEESELILLDNKLDEDYLVDIEDLKNKYEKIIKLNEAGLILSANSVKQGGIIKSLIEMSLGNKIGININASDIDLFKEAYGAIVIEVKDLEAVEDIFEEVDYINLGLTNANSHIKIDDLEIDLNQIAQEYTNILSDVFKPSINNYEQVNLEYNLGMKIENKVKEEKVKVLIPILPGTHSEYSLASLFKENNAEVEEFIFKSENIDEVKESYKDLAEKIKYANIIAFPDGEVYANEPLGGKLLDVILNNELVKQAIKVHLEEDDGLVIGIGNGFEGILRAGLIEGDYRIVENSSNKFISEIVDVKVNSNLSPWFSKMQVGDIYSSALATKNGRILCSSGKINNEQIATQFVNENITGSENNIESLTSKDGRVLGTLTSIDRNDKDLYKNIDIKGIDKIIDSGVSYFK